MAIEVLSEDLDTELDGIRLHDHRHLPVGGLEGLGIAAEDLVVCICQLTAIERCIDRPRDRHSGQHHDDVGIDELGLHPHLDDGGILDEGVGQIRTQAIHLTLRAVTPVADQLEAAGRVEQLRAEDLGGELPADGTEGSHDGDVHATSHDHPGHPGPEQDCSGLLLHRLRRQTYRELWRRGVGRPGHQEEEKMGPTGRELVSPGHHPSGGHHRGRGGHERLAWGVRC